MTEDELKVRQLTNQYLVLPGEKLTVLRDLNGFQAQFMGNALHAMKIRCSDYTPETAAWGLVKNWTIRGTVHFTNIAPATIRDAMYYFHTTREQVKNWLDRLPVTSTECGGRTYYDIENGRSDNTPIPACIFLRKIQS